MEVSILIAFFSSAMAIAILRPLSPRLQLVDLPTQRKQHVGAVPLIGGIAVCIGVLLSAVTSLPYHSTMMTLLCCGMAMVVLGAIDDARDLSPWSRLLCQAMTILVISFSSGVSLESFGNVLGFGDIHLPAPLNMLLTVIAISAAINAYNMMDGIDGLAGSMAACTLLGLALMFFNVMPMIQTLCIMICAALVPYLMVNLGIPPFKKKIFLGDAGSMFLGFIIGFLVIYGSQANSPAHAFRPVTALWLIGLPLIDMVGIMFRRIRKGHSPMRADRNHLHHILLHAGFSAREALMLIVLFNVVITGTGIWFEQLHCSEWVMMVAYILGIAIYTFLLTYAWKIGLFVRNIKRLSVF